MGIGLATSKRLIREGCAVTDKARVDELAKTAAAEMGQVDILIDNAGYVMRGLVPSELYQWAVDLIGVTGSMKCWVGRGKAGS